MLTFDTFLSTTHPPRYTESEVLDNAIRYAGAAERLGYGGVWLTEHHFIPRVGLCPSSLVMAAFLLGHTRTLRVGTAVSIAPLYHPVQLAEQAALLDHLGAGRFDFGLGKGGFPADLAVFDRREADLHPRLRQAVAVILRAWTQDTVSSDGPFAPFPPVSVVPRPRTQPHPPVYVVGQSPQAIDLAARHGLPLMLSFTCDDVTRAQQLAMYRDRASAYGHDPQTITHACAVLGYVVNSRRELDQSVRPALQRFFEASHDASFPVLGAAAHTPSRGYTQARVAERIEHFLSFSPIGSADQCRERLQALVERTAVQRIVVLGEWAAERDAVLDAMERFAREVIDRMRHERTTRAAASG